MSRPGTNVSLLEQPNTGAVSNDTGTGFMAGLANQGSATVANLVQSISQFVTVYGDRQSYSSLYDCVETFFREGGGRLYIGRVVGPSATTGTKNLLDSGAGISLVASANGPGAWSAGIKVGVVAGTGSNFQIVVKNASDVVLEQSADLVDQASAVAWSNYSNYIRIALGATALLPAVVAAGVLSTGDDDRGSIVDAQWATALGLFTASLGPGQIMSPGRTTSAAYAQLKAQAESTGRDFLYDHPNTPTVATLVASAATITSRFGAGFAPWDVIPGLVSGTTRTVPPVARQAGTIARNDPASGTNQASAGPYGLALFVTDISQPDWNDADRLTLNNAAVNVSRRMGGVRTYGWRASVNATSDASWVPFGNGRLYMDLAADFNLAAEEYVFAKIDGPTGKTITGFNDALTAICMDRFNRKELYGDTSDEAFVVDTGVAVNTLTTIAAQELRAQVRVRMAPMAEYVVIQIVKRQVTQAV